GARLAHRRGGTGAEGVCEHHRLPLAQPVCQDRRGATDRHRGLGTGGGLVNPRLDRSGQTLMSTGVAWVRRAALLAVLCFLSMLGYTLYSLNNLQNELAEDVGENMVWALSQGVYQSGRLHLAHEMSGADFMIQRSLLK